MYSFIIFIIAFILLLFEVTVNLLFGNSLNPDTIILVWIMVLPGILYRIRQDSIIYRSIMHGQLQNRISKRKRSFFLLERVIIYGSISIGISILHLGLGVLLSDKLIISYSLISCLIFLMLITMVSLFRSLFNYS